MAPLNTFYISMMMDYELCKGNVDVPSDAQKFELYSSRFSWWGDCTGCHRSRSLRNRRRDATTTTTTTEQHGFKMLFDGCYRSSSSTSTTGSPNPKNGNLKSVVFKLLICQKAWTFITKQMGWAVSFPLLLLLVILLYLVIMWNYVPTAYLGRRSRYPKKWNRVIGFQGCKMFQNVTNNLILFNH